MTVYNVLIPKNENDGYGIKIVSEKHLYDISYNYSAIEKLCNMCNTLNVDPAHFGTVLEEFLSKGEDF